MFSDTPTTLSHQQNSAQKQAQLPVPENLTSKLIQGMVFQDN